MRKSEMGFIILIVAIALAITCFLSSTETQEIKDWCAKRNDAAVAVDSRIMSTGPYWYDKNQRVYRVMTVGGNIYWFRYRWGRTIYQETSSGQYTPIED